LPEKSLKFSKKILLIDEHIVKDIHILKLNILGCDSIHNSFYDLEIGYLFLLIKIIFAFVLFKKKITLLPSLIHFVRLTY
jgi:hypothetical protein